MAAAADAELRAHLKPSESESGELSSKRVLKLKLRGRKPHDRSEEKFDSADWALRLRSVAVAPPSPGKNNNNNSNNNNKNDQPKKTADGK